jgi:hypothetical protein
LKGGNAREKVVVDGSRANRKVRGRTIRSGCGGSDRGVDVKGVRVGTWIH